MRRGAMKHASHTFAGTLAGVRLASLAALLLGGCGEGNGAAPCLPEDVERCSCEDGRTGFQVCAVDGGGGFGICDCDDAVSPYLPEAGVEASSEADVPETGGGLSFMSPCDPTHDECPVGTTCDAFSAKGPHCSKPCTVATDCPAPSTGCNMMNICKAP